MLPLPAKDTLVADVVAHYTRVAESGAWPRHAHRLGAGQWEYNRELLREALATRPEQRARFLTWLETNHAIYEDVGAHRSGGRPGGADKHLLRHIDLDLDLDLDLLRHILCKPLELWGSVWLEFLLALRMPLPDNW